jgi:hypothetical protein
MGRRYLHELPVGAQKAVLRSNMKVGEFMKKWKQPDWCKYPDATEGIMGCWSLMSGYVTGPEYCKGCDMFSPTGCHKGGSNP